MRKIATVFFVFSLVAGGCSDKQEEKLKEEVLLPEGYRGCAYVVYDIKGAPELEIKDNIITYKLNEKGILATSSPETFGWIDEKTSPNIDRHYYYVDENEKKEEVARDGIHHEGNGAGSVEGSKEYTFFNFYIGSKMDYERFGELSNGLGCLNVEDIVRKLNLADSKKF